MAFGLFNWIALSYFGDVLLIYAAAAILLFPFRLLSIRWLLCIFAAFLVWKGAEGYESHVEKIDEIIAVDEAREAKANGASLSEEEEALLEKFDARDRMVLPEKFQEEFERSAALHEGGITFFQTGYFHFRSIWESGELWNWAVDSFFAMILGLALFKMGFTQGSLASRTYLLVMLFGYGIGWALRIYDLQFDIAKEPSPVRIIAEVPRMLISMGHIAVLHLLYKSRAGNWLVRTLGQVGRMAFSAYLIQSFVMVYVIAAPWGFNLYQKID